MPFARLGAFAHRHRRSLPVGGLVLMVLLLLLSGPLGGSLQAGGFSVPGSQSQRASQLLTRHFGAATTQLLLVYRSPRPDVTSPEVQAKVAASFARLARRPEVVSVQTYSSTRLPIFIGDRGYETFAVVNLKMTEVAASDQLPQLESYLSRPTGLTMWVTGPAPIDALYNSALEAQLRTAELIALPISLLLLLLVFGSVTAALLPLLIAGLSVPTALSVIRLIAAHFSMSIFVTNVATIVGLGLAIDYSLFFVKRFREELTQSPPEVAVVAATASAGKAVAISGTAVALGLLSLTLFPATALGSMGIGGVVVVACTLLFALTVLPAILSLLGHRLNWLTLRRGLRGATDLTHHQSSFWGWAGERVMRHPVAIALPVAVLLLWVGTPFLSLRLSTGASVQEIPAGPARTGYSQLVNNFPQAGGVNDLNMVVDYGHQLGGRLTPAQQSALSSYLARAERLTGVQGVDGVLTPPPGVPARVYLGLLSGPPAQRPAGVEKYIAGYLAGPVAQFEVATAYGPDSSAGAQLVSHLRQLAPPPGTSVLYGGGAAVSVDFLAAFANTIPWAVAMVVLATMAVLFLTFGSVVLPIKAVLMSLISISASFGAMVWIFQEGHLSRLLDFTSPGSITATDPVLMFAFIFGLSMDYEVFLLTRIRERYLATGDNRRAVQEGMASTGGVITSAALIMIAVFGAFALGHVLDIQILGLGMAVAVAVDASLVRGIMVPALMRLLGRANWWAPGPAQRLVARLGLYESPAPVPPAKAA